MDTRTCVYVDDYIDPVSLINPTVYYVTYTADVSEFLTTVSISRQMNVFNEPNKSRKTTES